MDQTSPSRGSVLDYFQVPDTTAINNPTVPEGSQDGSNSENDNRSQEGIDTPRTTRVWRSLIVPSPQDPGADPAPSSVRDGARPRVRWADEDCGAPVYTTDPDGIVGLSNTHPRPLIPLRRRLDLRRANSMPPNRQPPGYGALPAPVYVSPAGPAPPVQREAPDAIPARRRRDRLRGLGSKLVAKIKKLTRRSDGPDA